MHGAVSANYFVAVKDGAATSAPPIICFGDWAPLEGSKFSHLCLVPPAATPAWPSSFERSFKWSHSGGFSAEVAAGSDVDFARRRWKLTAPGGVALRLRLGTSLSRAVLAAECERFGLAHSWYWSGLACSSPVLYELPHCLSAISFYSR